MQENQRINDEIRKFLELNTQTNYKIEDRNLESRFTDLTHKPNVGDANHSKDANLELILAGLNDLQYKDIESSKESKFTAINNNLINLVKMLIEERKSKEEEIKVKDSKIKVLKEETIKKDKDYNILTNKLKYDKMKVEEDKRIFKDQKERFLEYKIKYEQQLKSFEGIKILNNELEILRQKEKEKNEYLEKQMNIFGDFLKEKDSEIKKYKKLISEKEIEIENSSKKLKSIEEELIHYKDLSTEKENIINVLNNEMKDLLNNKNEIEKVKSKLSYYEKMYKSVSKQNDYLNKELSKAIKRMPSKITNGKTDKKPTFNHNLTSSDQVLSVSLDSTHIDSTLTMPDFGMNNHARNTDALQTNHYATNKTDNFRTKNVNDYANNKIDESVQDLNASVQSFSETFSFESFCIENKKDLNDKLKNMKIDASKKEREKGYKKRLKKLKKLYETKKIENEKKEEEIKNNKNKIFDLANEIKNIKNENENLNGNYKNLNEKLFEKIENLMENNKNLQREIFEIKKHELNKNEPKENYYYNNNNNNNNIRVDDNKARWNGRRDGVIDDFEFMRNIYKETDSFQSLPENNKESTKFESPLNAQKYEDLEEIRGFRKMVENNELENPFTILNKDMYNAMDENNHNGYKNNGVGNNVAYKSAYEGYKKIDDEPKNKIAYERDYADNKTKKDKQKNTAYVSKHAVNKKTNDKAKNNAYESTNQDNKTKKDNKADPMYHKTYDEHRNANVAYRPTYNYFDESRVDGTMHNYTANANAQNDANLDNNLMNRENTNYTTANDSTTSSLKNMIDRTEKLKERFDDLETKLQNIKIEKPEDDKKNLPPVHIRSVAKPHKKNNLFSDGIDLDNSSDVI